MANPKPVKTMILCLLWLSIALVLTGAYDPDPLQDFCVADETSAGSVKVNGFACKDPKMVKASDFLFQGLRNEGSTNNIFGSLVTVGNVEKFAGLNTLGISMNRVDFAPGGVNPPHIHPRATEIAFVVEGTILAGFITTNNTLFTQKLEKGDVFVFPRGLVPKCFHSPCLGRLLLFQRMCWPRRFGSARRQSGKSVLNSLPIRSFSMSATTPAGVLKWTILGGAPSCNVSGL